MGTATCRSCCASCKSTPPSSSNSSSSVSPYALSNFLPAGTIQLHLNAELDFCSHAHAEDSWHYLSDTNLTGLTDVSSEDLYRSLLFLIQHHFVAATYRHTLDSGSDVIVRVYIIPYDLPNVNGRLSYRVRSRETSPVLSLAQKHMVNVFPKIVQDQASWTCGDVHSGSGPSFLNASPDQRTLPEIYGDLPSPSPRTKATSTSLIRRFLDDQDDLDGLGLRSTLHRYQRHSVAAMLEREQPDHLDTVNPLYITLTGLDGRTFYYQPGTTETLREQSVVSLPPGGVLCEELGTGKTVMIIALILATMKQLSKPEESAIDDRPVLTPLALRHFPSGDFSASRERLQRSRGPKHAKTLLQTPENSASRIPTFRELLLHELCTNPSATAADLRLVERYEKLQSYESWRKANTPFYFHFKGDLTDFWTSARGRTSDPGPRIMYLSSATLVVVPPNLISQWDREVKKHCEESPRLLIVRTGTPLPSAKVLASDYDIVLMTYPRFCEEDRQANIHKAYSWKVCKCAEFPNSRIPKCECTVKDLSPLLQIRWKRLVIDEGHVSSSLTTRLTPFTRLLSVHARWIVTGTPTTNLLGLSFGSASENENDLAVLGSSDIPSNTRQDMDIDSSSLSQSELGDDDPKFGDTIIESAVGPSSSRSARIWNSLDSLDIQKLTNMIAQFVGVKFLADHQVIRTHIKEPLFAEDGPRPGAIQMLIQLMNSIMIRHRITDVEKEVTLPKLTHELVFLDLDHYARMSYNALQAGIMINAIDSQRTDKDYMFHPANVEFLQLTMKNMSQLMFWSVDSNLYNVEELSENIEGMLQLAEEQKKDLSKEEIALAKEALHHARLACRDSVWRRIQSHEDVPFRAHRMPFEVMNIWSRFTLNERRHSSDSGNLIHPDRLLRLRKVITQRPLIDAEALCSEGRDVVETELLTRQINEEKERKKERKDRVRLGPQRRQNQTSNGTNDLKALSVVKNASSADTIEEMRRELKAALARLATLENSEDGNIHSSPTIKIEPSRLLSSSLLAPVRVGNSASSKLNYICEEVLKHSAHEKFLIFSESALTLAHIYEALTLLQIKSLQFTTQHKAQFREQLVLTFETSDVYRVFLMELKHGARGLNLVTASRVIFCEPVWQADVESQAIKRAHRIGQTKPVSVKTLVIRGTAEEKMLERRQVLKTSGDKVPKLLEEAGMRHFIEFPEFITASNHKDNATPRIDFSLLRPSRVNVSPTPSSSRINETPTPPRKRVRMEEPISTGPEGVGIVRSPPKKRAVHFG